MILSPADDDIVTAWADGLMHKYYASHTSGRCSLAATIAFDVAEFESLVSSEIARMERILAARGAYAGGVR